MKLVANIHHRVDLALTILDSSNGRQADGHLRIQRDGKELKFRKAPDGTILFIDTGREDFEFEVNIYGYEPETVSVKYADLDEQIPTLRITLIPKDPFGDNYLTIDGSVPGLIGVDAVSLVSSAFIAVSIDERKRLMTVQSLYNQELPSHLFGIIEKDETRFEPIEIIKVASNGTYKLTKVPEVPVAGMRLAYRVTGRVRDGTGLLRLPNDGSKASWIVRIAAKSENSYRILRAGDVGTDEAGKHIGIDALLKLPKPKRNERHEQDAEAKGG
jgi:hypothetical protein